MFQNPVWENPNRADRRAGNMINQRQFDQQQRVGWRSRSDNGPRNGNGWLQQMARSEAPWGNRDRGSFDLGFHGPRRQFTDRGGPRFEVRQGRQGFQGNRFQRNRGEFSGRFQQGGNDWGHQRDERRRDAIANVITGYSGRSWYDPYYGTPYNTTYVNN